MKTLPAWGDAAHSPIVHALRLDEAPAGDPVARARSMALPLVAGQMLSTGEPVLAHGDGTAAILESIGAAPELRAAAWLLHAADRLGDPDAVIAASFGESLATLVAHTRKLGDLQRMAQDATADAGRDSQQTERVRKMLLAFSRDLRVVLLRLASRLQTLRWYASSKRPCPGALAREARDVFAPLANRLGIGRIKWELEDLSFRILDAEGYFGLARRLDERRADRESHVGRLAAELRDDLAAHGIHGEVQGRPKHLYSIWKKMRAKSLDFERVLDVLALRVVVGDVAACYAALARVHERWQPVAGEFDDYIARPKANGYRSLHTVVETDDGRAVEIQVRTSEMHEHAEHGVSAHWAYKESDPTRTPARAAGAAADRIASARLVVLRQLLAWERDIATDGAGEEGAATGDPHGPIDPTDERIYVLTPEASLVELTAGATAVDFAYAVHTDLGHRCRGAKVDGVLVRLDTPLRNGQTVEITSAKTGGPSADWLNPELGYLRSPRSRAKVRAWFNARSQTETIARGRDAIERLLQREGKTATKLDDLAGRLGFRTADELFAVIGKEELSLRNVETLLRPPPLPKVDDTDQRIVRRSRAGESGGVLVVGVDSLLTGLARCCRPAPPDAIAGYVTRGKGVAVHRTSCTNLRELTMRSPERVIPVAWGQATETSLYPVDVVVAATDRHGLLRDVSEVFARDKVNVVGVKSSSVRNRGGAGDGTAFMTFTVEIADAARLAATLTQVAAVPGVRSARRR